ncbi:MAG: M20 family metallopeptidase [Polyangiaceae bacterium]|jgi:hippurate hydrolase|nr:M20 family metallopeptidase [Polyangiaceae bacterium]
MKLIDEILAHAGEFQAIRRDIHAHPELRYEEHRTAELVATQLAGLGLDPHRGLGGTGVVASIRQGSSGRSIGLRADMDALPMEEHNGFAHRSRNSGKMHACGHDGHTAMLLAAARYLARHRRFDGTVHLIFQPAEEGGAGARRMIQEGLFQKFPCDAVFGLHNWPGLAVGQLGVRPGAQLASSNEFEIRIQGKGAHAAMPHLGVDPVMVAVGIAQMLQTIISRNRKPIEAAVLSITQIHAGSATNVIPDEATMQGTVRTFSVEAIDLIEGRMREVVEHVALAHGAAASLAFHRNYPPLLNHRREAEFCASVMEEIVGPAGVLRDIEPTMGAEDFAFMLQERPGAYVFLGNGDGAHRAAGHGLGPCSLHNPSYDFNDALIPLGATYWVRLVERWLAPAPAP